MKKILLTFFLSLGLFSCFNFANAEINLNDDKVDIDFFYSKTCPHCKVASDFLKEISLKDSDIKIERHEVGKKDSFELLLSYYDKYNVEEEYQGGVPVIFIEDYYFVGFQKGYSEQKIEETIDALINNKEIEMSNSSSGNVSEIKREVILPFIGTIDAEKTSPLIFSIVFGILDGFNACAMAALAFLLAVLIGMGDRKKLILIGGIFILVSGIVYYLFIGAWLNIFLLLPHMDIITYIIGIIIIVFGVLVLKEFFNGVICKLCEIDPKKENWFSKTQKKLMLKMQQLINSKKPTILIIGAVILIATGINLIELVCSFGLPVAFTKILTSYNVSSASYYFYLLIYVFFYMLDDLIIFLIAVFTFNLAQESEKYIRVAKFISGVLLIVLGIIIIFFPNVLGAV